MILVVAEQQRGKLHRATWEAIAAAQELAAGETVDAILLGAAPAAAAAELSGAALGTVHVVDSSLLEPYTPDAYTHVLQRGDRFVAVRPSSCCRIHIARATSRQSWRPASIARS